MTVPTKPEVVDFIKWFAPQFNLDPKLHIRQCQAESNFNQQAVSPCGALRLLQLMPATAKDLKVDPRDWKQNLSGGLRYMAQLKKQFGSNDKALAAYNWGMGNLTKCIQKHGDKWREYLPLETSNYLKKILAA